MAQICLITNSAELLGQFAVAWVQSMSKKNIKETQATINLFRAEVDYGHRIQIRAIGEIVANMLINSIKKASQR